MAEYRNSQEPNRVFVYAVVVVVLFFLVINLYKENKSIVNNLIMLFNYYALKPFYYLPFGSETAKLIINKFSWDSPGRYTWDQMIKLTSATGSYWRWILTPISLYFCYLSLNRVSIEKEFSRTFNMRTLLKNNVKEFPYMAPVANIDLLQMPLYEGYWEVPLSPLEFAVKHNLILDSNNKTLPKQLFLDKDNYPNEDSSILKKTGPSGIHLDRMKTINLFSKQVGKKYSGMESLPYYLIGLSAVFMLKIIGGHKNNEKADELINLMSLSYKNEKNGKPISLDIGDAREVYKNLEYNPLVQKAIKFHTAYVSTFMIALLINARKKSGVITTTQFIWLRPINKTMFLILNQIGGQRPFAESIGPWIHYLYEEMSSQPIYDMNLDTAFEDFCYDIAELGFIDEYLINSRKKDIVRKNKDTDSDYNKLRKIDFNLFGDQKK